MSIQAIMVANHVQAAHQSSMVHQERETNALDVAAANTFGRTCRQIIRQMSSSQHKLANNSSREASATLYKFGVPLTNPLTTLVIN